MRPTHDDILVVGSHLQQRAASVQSGIQIKLVVQIIFMPPATDGMLCVELAQHRGVVADPDVAHPRSAQQFGPGGPQPLEVLLAHSLSNMETIELPDGSLDPRHDERVEGRFPFPVRSCLVMPLSSEPVLGAMGLFTKRGGRPFEEEDRSLMAPVRRVDGTNRRSSTVGGGWRPGSRDAESL